jgi:hypothetical protein
MRNFILENSGTFPGPDYGFSGFSQSVSWPQEDGRRLGMAGAWNFLLRIGACPQIVEENNLHVPEEGDVLYVIADAVFSKKTEKVLQDWITAGGRVLASGCPEAWRFAFPKDIFLESARLDNPYSALAWLQEGSAPELVAPPQWTYLRVQTNKSVSIECRGKLAAISGERQTPKRALISPLEDAPAILSSGNLIYFNGNPFAALQAWLQGQENLEPWLAWRHRFFWLDELSAFLYKNLQRYKLLPEEGNGIPGLAKTTVVFKHDLDYSRDTAYLNMETQAELSGVHSILKDSNTKFWINVLKANPGHESALHYNTGRYSRVLEAVCSKLLGLPKRSIRPDRKAIEGKGLLNQVKWAKDKGIGIKTLHRHLSIIIYPELIDALDTVYRSEREVLGSNSFFRGQVLRWGTDRVDGMRGTLADFPDPQFPYWFPFRLAHAGHGGRLLRGWESTSVMEVEPGMVEQMLDYNIPGLPQKVLILNYHPAHANRSTFAKEGCADWFRDILGLCKNKGVQVRTLSEVYKVLNDHLKGTYGK